MTAWSGDGASERRTETMLSVVSRLITLTEAGRARWEAIGPQSYQADLKSAGSAVITREPWGRTMRFSIADRQGEVTEVAADAGAVSAILDGGRSSETAAALARLYECAEEQTSEVTRALERFRDALDEL